MRIQHLTLLLLLSSFVTFGCSDSAEKDGDTTAYERECQDTDFVYTDEICGPPRDGGSQCEDYGDGKCYARCESDSDCTEAARPHCSVLGLYNGGDYNCNDSVKVCHSESFEDCQM